MHGRQSDENLEHVFGDRQDRDPYLSLFLSLSLTHSLSGTGIKLERTHGPLTKVNSSSETTTTPLPQYSIRI